MKFQLHPKSTERAARLLDWQPQYTVADPIADSLLWVAVRDAVLTGS